MLNKKLNKGRKARKTKWGFMPVPAVTCADGFDVSIQCSSGHYCSPRKDLDDVSLYTHFELGFPSELDELLEEYAEEPGTTETVFHRVPREVIEELLDNHGGIV